MYWAFADWLNQGYFPYMEQRDILEPRQVICAGQMGADWLAQAFLFRGIEAQNIETQLSFGLLTWGLA